MRLRPGVALGGTLLAACVRVVAPEAGGPPPCTMDTRSDVFTTQGSAQVDILLVLDTSSKQGDVIKVLPARLNAVLRRLMNPRNDNGPLPPPDFHLAVAPTNLAGELLPLAIQPLLRREACTNAVDLDQSDGLPPRPDGGVGPDRPNVNCPDCPRYLARSQCACQGLDTPVCANLFAAPPLLASPPVDGVLAPPSASPMETLRAALGMFPACGADRTTTDPPATNSGFYRPDAALVVVFVTGGDGEPDNTNAQLREAHYRETLEALRRIKGTGKEGLVTAVTIGGICMGGACEFDGRQTLSQIAPGLGDPPNPADYCLLARRDLQDAAASCGRVNLGGATTPLDQLGGCLVTEGGMERLRVQSAPFLMTLACDLGGVIYNACAPDWSSVITGTVGQLLGPGEMTLSLQQPTTATSTSSTCGDPFKVCVTAAPPNGAGVDLPDNQFALLDASSVLITASLPAGTRVVVTYPTASPQCCAGSCPAAASCNALGFCQAQACSVQVGCAGDGEQCDVQRGRCLAPGSCSLDEHCPAGARCDCQAQRCVPREDGICTP